MTPAERAQLVARVKRIAQPFANAVARRSEHHIGLLTSGMSREELIALAVIGYEAADPDLLRAVTEADDDGMVARPATTRGSTNAA